MGYDIITFVDSLHFSDRVKSLGTENSFTVLAKVTELKKQGRDIVSFGIGEPDFDTPKNIVDAGVKALQSGSTHYSPSQGIESLRKSAASYITRTRHIAVQPEEVVIMPGGKPLIFNAIMACVNPGEEVIYPNPGYPIYESVVEFTGCKAVPLPFLEEKKFGFDVNDLKHLITKKTRLVVINSPQNPTGGILEKQNLEELAALAQEHNLWILSDEIYSQIVYDGEFMSIVSLPGMKERTIILDGFSKTYAMTGWRLGIGVMNAELAVKIARVETNLNSCTATFTQIAGVEALDGDQSAVKAMREEFKRRREVIIAGLNSVSGFKCLMPKGAFYAFPNVTEACKRCGFANSEALQEYLLYDGNVAVLPRTSFGRRNTGEKEEYIRLSYATSMENIHEGLKRIKTAIEKKIGA